MSVIVQLANFVSPRSGGLRTTMDALAAGYRSEGHQVVQVVPGPVPGAEEFPGGRRVVVRGLPLPGTGYRLIVPPGAAERAVRRLRPDRLEVHDRATLRTVAARTGVPSLVVSHERLDRLLAEWLPLPSRLITGWADRSNAALAAGHDRVVCTTHWAAEEFTRLEAPVTRVPLGVDLQQFQPAGTDGPETRHRLAGDAEALLVLASRLSREKRPGLAVDTLAELVRRGRRVRLVVAGHGPERPALEARAAGLPVEFLGFVHGKRQLARVLAAADVALAPGPVETFGLAGLEALACGTPVVADARSAVSEVLGSTGGLAVPGGAADFADAVEAVLESPPGRFTPRARAELFPWSATVSGFLTAHGLPAGVAA